MSSATSFLTSLSASQVDPFQLVMESLPASVLWSLLVALLAPAVFLGLMSIDITWASNKPTRLERLGEAPLFSKRSWLLAIMFISPAVFLWWLAGSIVSAWAQMNLIEALATVIYVAFISLLVLALAVSGFDAAKRSLHRSRLDKVYRG